MIPIDYLFLRLLRRFLPSSFIRAAMKLRIGVEPGLETREPELAADRYEVVMQEKGHSLQGKRVLLLGYGGYFGVAVALLNRGAEHVVLLDPYAQVDHEMNRELAKKTSAFLEISEGEVRPKSEWITIIQDLKRDYLEKDKRPIDLVLSSSVLEHVSNLHELVHELSSALIEEGMNIHFVDLRDHFFKYPFEMLCHSEVTWARYLNPTSNLNRLRVWEYEEIFEHRFGEVEIEIIETEREEFTKRRGRIRPEFVSGNEDHDCAARIIVKAALPHAAA